MRSIAALAASVGLLGACGDDGGSQSTPFDAAPDVDALPAFSCWPDIEPIPRGSVTLGAGGVAFAEMSDTLPIEWGVQDGYMVKVWVRMTGFLPGQAPVTSPENPFTRIRASFAETGVSLMFPGECASRVWYEPNDAGSYDLYSEAAVMFDTCWRTDRLIGAQIEIDAEVMDATGSYGRDTRIITATAPVGEYPPDPPTPDYCGT